MPDQFLKDVNTTIIFVNHKYVSNGMQLRGKENHASSDKLSKQGNTKDKFRQIEIYSDDDHVEDFSYYAADLLHEFCHAYYYKNMKRIIPIVGAAYTKAYASKTYD